MGCWAVERETETIGGSAGDGPASPGQSFRSRNQRVIRQVGAGFGELAFFHQGRATVVTSLKTTRFVVRVRWEVFRSGSPFLFGFCQRDPKVPSSHCSRIRRMSFGERQVGVASPFTTGEA